MSQKLKPLGSRVVVRRDAAEEKAPGGRILVPENARKKPRRGEVLAAGPGHRNSDGVFTPLSVKAGDRVLFSQPPYGAEHGDLGDDVIILDESDLLAVEEQ